MSKTLILALAVGLLTGSADATDVLCIYYPEWHVYPEGEEIFGKGRTEWDLVTTAKPRFAGHEQPVRLEAGCPDDSDPNDVAKEIDLAADAGITAFVYDWYWADGHPIQHEALERGFMKAPNRGKMKFAIMWANHDRSNAFRPELGKSADKYWWKLDWTSEEFLAAIDYCIKTYFAAPEYYRKDGKLFFSVYSAVKLINKLGGPAKMKATLAEAQARMRRAGLPPIHFSAMIHKVTDCETVLAAGYDSTSAYNVTPYDFDDNDVGRQIGRGKKQVLTHEEFAVAHDQFNARMQKAGELPFIPVATRGWDCTPRCRQDEPFPWKSLVYPYLGVVTGLKPNVFAEILSSVKRQAESDPKQPGAVLVNAWNEYTEGCYLMPDRWHGDAFRQKVKQVFADNGPIDPQAFADPPRKYSPHVWWHWMNGNISKAGITADLEALAGAGIGGAMLFDASCGIPEGPVKFYSPEFFDMVRHAAKEAKRLGMALGVANGTGWANSGGPWITPADAMKFTTVSETPAEGSRRFEAVLPRTTDDHGFYEDIAVMAVRDFSAPIEANVSVTDHVVTVTSDRPVTAAGFSWRLAFKWHWSMTGDATVEVSEDGTTFRKLEDLPFQVSYFNTAIWGLRRHTFVRPVTFKALRFTTKCAWPITIAEFRLENEQRLEDLDGKKLRYKMPFAATKIEVAGDGILGEGDVIDLTGRMSADGKIAWDVPEGKWTVLRIGYCANGQLTSSSGSTAGRGLEVDKLAVSPVERHFEAYVGKLKRLLGADGDVVTMVLNDSFESGSQNWTQGFADEFRRRKGYDLRPFLPTFTGRIVSSVEKSEKFLADYREVLGDMFAENYAGTLQRKAHEYGMDFYLEPYGNGPSDDRTYARYCDVPMTEFWAHANTDVFHMSTGPNIGYAEEVVASADCWGQPIVGAEAFTASCGWDRWQVMPYSIKAQCDHIYELGVNRMIFHRFVHQPYDPPQYPGMTMGPWGMHFDRTQTWWPEAKEFVAYQRRCQYLLQQGVKVADDLCHRRDATADWYFVTSTNHFPVTVEKTCAVVGRVPEIWYPEDGRTVRASRWRVEDGKTVVSVDLPIAGCAFVVFRASESALPVERVTKETARTPIAGPWQVSFKSLCGGAPTSRTFEKLTSWTEAEDPLLKYFSGSATYVAEFAAKPEKGVRYVLDLGDVRDFATVTLNGKAYRALWKPPFEVDVTDVLSESNRLEVRITNRWPNRLIGDDFLPENERFAKTTWKHWSKKDKPLVSGLLGPVALVEGK